MRKPCWVTTVLMMVADVGLDSGVSIQGSGVVVWKRILENLSALVDLSCIVRPVIVSYIVLCD